MESLDIEYIDIPNTDNVESDDTTSNDTSSHTEIPANVSSQTCKIADINNNQQVIKINEKEYSLEDLFDRKSISALKTTDITLGKLLENDAIKHKLLNVLNFKTSVATNKVGDNIWYSHKYNNGAEFQLSISKDGRPNVKFYDPDLNTTFTTNFAFKTRCNGEVVWVFRVGRGPYATTLGYCFNFKNGAFKRVNLNEVCLNLPSAREFRDAEECDFNPSMGAIGSLFTWDTTYSVFEQKGFICGAGGDKQYDNDNADTLKQSVMKASALGADTNNGFTQFNSTKFNNLEASQYNKDKINFNDIKYIVLTKKQIETEILEITDKIMLNPYYDVCDVWNKLTTIQQNLSQSLLLKNNEIVALNSKISGIQRTIKNKRLIGEDKMYQQDYTNLLLNMNARVDPVSIFNQAQQLKEYILNSNVLKFDKKNHYILQINKIQDSLGLYFSKQQATMCCPYSNIMSMSTFHNRAICGLRNMQYYVNDYNYPTMQPINIANNLLNTNIPMQFYLRY